MDSLQDRLKKFAEYVLESYCWTDCPEPDGADIQEKAESLGLIEFRKVNPNDFGADELYLPVWYPKKSSKSLME